MNYLNKLHLMRDFARENFTSAPDLVEWLELSIEDVLAIFPDALVNHYERVYPLDLEELNNQSDEQELQAWNSYEVDGAFQPSEDFWDES